MISKNDIEKAANRIEGKIHRTPILTLRFFNEKSGAEFYFKGENFQKTGSFKARGAMNSVLQLSDNQKNVATHSSGNHGQALAWAARENGKTAYIVMPKNAPKVKIEAVKSYGAKVIFCEPTLRAREETLEKTMAETGAVFIPPYNFENTIGGQATCAKEIFSEINEVDFLLAPVGGGGLLSGSALAAKYFSHKTQVIGCEPEKADDAFQSFRKNKLVPSKNPDTIADGLRTSLGDLTFPIIRENIADILLCGEDEIRAAMRQVWERMKIIIEPSAAVAVACLLKNAARFQGKKVAIILSGGNVDLEEEYFT